MSEIYRAPQRPQPRSPPASTRPTSPTPRKSAPAPQPSLDEQIARLEPVARAVAQGLASDPDEARRYVAQVMRGDRN